MADRLHNLSQRYGAALCQYGARQEEALLQAAYEIGREAVATGLDLLDMARLHQGALVACSQSAPTPESAIQVLKAAEVFLMEALSPFEVRQRGFRETNLKLRELNETLALRNVALAEVNGELQLEITERKQTEEALRQSEEHYRVLFNEARQMQENLRLLSNQVLHVQEEERKHISRELHDEVGQGLTAINVHLTVLKKATLGDRTELRERIADAQQLAEQTMETVHRFARELRPAILDDLGLLPALRAYSKAFAERTSLRVSFSGCEEAEKLGDQQKIVLYRVAQESLTNVAKHAHANRVAMSLRSSKGGIQMEVKDDGKAFRVEEVNAGNGKKRLGLLGMQERVRLVNGEFAVESKPGRGTVVRVQIPFPAENSDHYEKNNCPAG